MTCLNLASKSKAKTNTKLSLLNRIERKWADVFISTSCKAKDDMQIMTSQSRHKQNLVFNLFCLSWSHFRTKITIKLTLK